MEIYQIDYHTVTPEDFASALGSGSLPVLATPRMIAWMEEASCKLVKLPEYETTVGISMNTTHDAPSLQNSRIRVVSHLSASKKKLSFFDVSAWMNNRCIGKGTHIRAAVDVSRFLEKAKNNQR